MNEVEPISETDMAAFVQRAWNTIMSGIADAPHGNMFELTSPATGQRFRVTVTEVVSGEAAAEAISAILSGGQ